MMFHSREIDTKLSQTASTMSLQQQEASLHILLPTLWDYSRGRFELSDAQMHHLLNCDACVSAMGLCHILPSINRVEEEMSEHALCGR